MKKVISLLLIAMVSFQFYNCKTEIKKTVEITTKEVVVEEPTYTNREPTDDEIREYGIIESIEDGQYPMFVVTLEFPKRKTKASFNLNIEAISQTSSDLDSLIGKYVSF